MPLRYNKFSSYKEIIYIDIHTYTDICMYLKINETGRWYSYHSIGPEID